MTRRSPRNFLAIDGDLATDVSTDGENSDDRKYNIQDEPVTVASAGMRGSVFFFPMFMRRKARGILGGLALASKRVLEGQAANRGPGGGVKAAIK